MSNSDEFIYEKELKPRALTWRSLSALLFSIFIVQPIIIYFFLISNMVLPVQAWVTIILWAELSRILASKLTKQELYILLIFQPVSTYYSLFFLGPIQNMYFSMSPSAETFNIAPYIPNWWAPTKSAIDEIYRSEWLYLHPVWMPILSIQIITLALGILADFALGYFNYTLFYTVEKLDFPSARAQAQTVVTLAEREPSKIEALLIAALAGVVSNLVSKFLPYLFGSFLYGGLVTYTYGGLSMDFTDYVDRYLPGATLTLTADMLWYVFGFLLPIKISIAQFLGAISFYVIGSHIVTIMNLWPPESKWATGWGCLRLIERANLYFYTSLTIGLALAAIIVPILLNPKPFMMAFSILKKASRTEGEGSRITPYLLLVLYMLPSLGLVFLIWYLTNFQFSLLYLFLFCIGGTFFVTYLSTASVGITFTGIPTVPYLRELSIYSSRYGGKEVWFTPLTMTVPGGGAVGVLSTGGSWFAQTFIQADLCEVKHREVIKTLCVLMFGTLLSGYLFVNILWRISPIPSSAYPATITSWPVAAITWARTQIWIWSGYLFRPVWIILGFILGGAIYAVGLAIRAPFILISFLTGSWMGVGLTGIPLYSPLALTIAQLIGSIIAQRFLAPKLGKSWYSIAPMVVTGFMVGDGLMEIFRAAMYLVAKSSWLLPY